MSKKNKIIWYSPELSDIPADVTKILFQYSSSDYDVDFEIEPKRVLERDAWDFWEYERITGLVKGRKQKYIWNSLNGKFELIK